MVQFALAFFGVMAVLMMYTPSARLKRWSPVVGLAGQPFWAMFAYTTEPTPTGIWFTCGLFTCSFSYGIYRQWFAEPPEPDDVYVELGTIEFLDRDEIEGVVLYVKEQ